MNKKLCDGEMKRLMEFGSQFIEDQEDKYLKWLATSPRFEWRKWRMLHLERSGKEGEFILPFKLLWGSVFNC